MGDAEEVDDAGTPMTAGERLREAREAAGMTLEEIATSTRIPTRHLESLEAGDFDRLPAPTYTIGFAKNFAAAVGLDRAEIGDQLRSEMGGSRPATTTPDVFEPADPARAMPRWLIFGTIAAILLFALLYNWWSNRALEGGEEPSAVNIAAPATPSPAVPAAQAEGPVVITANDTAWIEVKDGSVTLKQGELGIGQSYQVPESAVAPTLMTAKPEALRISIGTADAPPIGEAGKKVTVSLKPDDLLRPRPAASPAAVEPAASSPPAARRAPAQLSNASPPAAEPPANSTSTPPSE